MKTKSSILLLILVGCLLAASGCSTTKTDDRGVTIEQKRSGGLFN